MYDIPNSSCSANGNIENYRTSVWRRHDGARLKGSNMAAGNQWKHLEFTLALSKRFFSLLNLKTFSQALLSTYWLLRTRKCKANRYFCPRNILPRNNADVTRCEKSSKQSTELKTRQQIYV